MKFSEYETPEGFKVAIEQRIRQSAQEQGLLTNRLRQLYIFDRFLARAFAQFGDRLLLKGGVALELQLERARTTRDVDFLLSGDARQVLDELKAAAARDMGDGLVFAVSKSRQHPTIANDGAIYDGERFAVVPQLVGKPFGDPFGVDIAVGDTVVGETHRVEGSDAVKPILGFARLEPASCLLYPRESHVSEKLHAYTMPRKTPNSRVKDLPDIALLANDFAFTSHELMRALKATFATRGTHALPTALPDPLEAWGKPYAVLAKENSLPWADLAGVTQAAKKFLDPILGGAEGEWRPASSEWMKP